ncbi:nucleotidyltransferase [Williamsia herbipolensis]|uniref:Nucleotidyltransferase n=1 Tax=Williamsia herbipolensis TaxID=1603258 RepID=A0AAU4JZ44_9NOCA|nr:nucleotidyltransferase [Williamsia herbipolensis]
MNQTAEQYLNSVTSLWTPTAGQFDGARSHRSSIETRLDQTFGLREMFETGSLRHGTGVWQYSDADYIVSLKGVMPGSEWTTLNKVKADLQARFPMTSITVRRPAVVCNFSDGVVEVTPAYPNFKTNGDKDGYWIPDPTGGWMKTHPKDHNLYVNSVNGKHGGGAKSLARQAKIWKYKRNVPVSSCYLEMRAAKYADGEEWWSPVQDLYRYFNRLYGHGLAAMNDPTGLGSRFNATSSEANHTVALSRLSTAVTRARKAKEFQAAGNQTSAISQLKLLFDA